MRGIAPALFMVLVLYGTQASAATYTYLTAGNAVDSAGEAVNAKVTFNVSAGSMVVTVVNQQANTLSIGQVISSLLFTVNNGGAILGLASTDLAGSSGTQVTIGAGGTVSGVQAVSPVSHWTAGSSAGQTYLNDLLATGNPVNTIIGSASSGGSYATVNSTIAGNATNNPFIQNQATFTFNNPGLLATASLSGVSVGFGTTPGNTLKMVPEPGSLFLVSLGMIAALRMNAKRVMH